MGADDADQWVVEAEGECFGPVSRTELARWASEGRLPPSIRVRRPGAEDWRLPAEVPELADLPFLAPPKPASHDPESLLPPSPMTPVRYLAQLGALSPFIRITLVTLTVAVLIACALVPIVAVIRLCFP